MGHDAGTFAPRGRAPALHPVALQFLLALPVPAAAILLHEVGHFVAYRASGYAGVRLGFAATTVGVPPTGIDVALADAMAGAAGGVVSLLLLGLGVALVVVRGAHPLGLALVVFENLRVAILTVLAALNPAAFRHPSGWGFGELPGLAATVGNPPALVFLLTLLQLLLPVLALAFVLRRYPPGGRLAPALVTLGALLLGLAAWLLLLGPRILPG
jgi:hypothetical protein